MCILTGVMLVSMFSATRKSIDDPLNLSIPSLGNKAARNEAKRGDITWPSRLVAGTSAAFFFFSFTLLSVSLLLFFSPVRTYTGTHTLSLSLSCLSSPFAVFISGYSRRSHSAPVVRQLCASRRVASASASQADVELAVARIIGRRQCRGEFVEKQCRTKPTAPDVIVASRT